ncbi:RNA repair domain-containing protein [Catenulispora yoronensis]
MHTSQEIYHRVRWDARFDASRFVLGVEQRGREPKRVPLPSFDPQGDIPWHRVLFFEADGELVWDRASGLDALDASGAGLARRERLLAAPFFEARTPHVFTAAGWRPVGAGFGVGAGVGSGNQFDAARSTIKILTWNTLWDRYDGDLIHTDRRRPMLLTALATAAAAGTNVIALQEVEAALLKMLLAEPWVRREWTLGSDPRSSDVADSGLALLTRLPVAEAGWHALGRFKAVTALTVETATGPVVVANTHLSSDHSADGAGLRAKQLSALAEGLSGVTAPVVLVGDFNDDTDAPATRLGLTDAWTQVHGPSDHTPTFDPTVNPLAAVSSLAGEAKRLDRVLVRGWRASEIQLAGEVPDADGLFISDHYGLVALLSAEPAVAEVVSSTDASSSAGASGLDDRPTARTAVAWIPPEEVWGDIQEIRRRLDPQLLRWPPHVNVLFGFVSESEFDKAVPLLGKAAAAVPAFDVQLSQTRHFAHRSDSTLWLDPVDPDSTTDGWQKLRAALLERFPTFRDGDVYVPHLTLGKVADPARTPSSSHRSPPRSTASRCCRGEAMVLWRSEPW